MTAREAWGLVVQTFAAWHRDHASRLAAALAYYTLFSLAPVVIICLAIAGWVFGTAAAEGELYRHIAGVVGPDGAHAIETMVASARGRRPGVIGSAVGALVLLYGATRVFAQLRDGLNTVWGVSSSSTWVRGFVRGRVVGVAVVLLVGLLLLASLVATTALALLGDALARAVPQLAWLFGPADVIVSLALVTALIALLFRIVPDVRLRWADVWFGALITAVLFAAGKYVIGLYLSRVEVGSSFGAAGSLVVILFWVYYSAQILFLGAEFTHLWAQRRSRRSISPDRARAAAPARPGAGPAAPGA